MSKIVIIGAGAMGSAFALPCLDNNHDVNIVGTHLENKFIDNLKKNNNLHPGLNTKIPQEIKIFKFEKFDELLKSNVDLIVLGISSKGIEWVSDQLSKLYKDNKILFMGNSWSGILEFLRATDNAPEVREMFKAQLEQREQIKFKQHQRDIEK